MKIRSLVSSLLATITIASLFAGCGGGSDVNGVSSPFTGDGTAYRIKVSNIGQTGVQPSFYNEMWTSDPGRLGFAMQVAGSRGGPGIDFELYKSSNPIDWSGKSIDLNSLVKIEVFKAGTPAEYSFMTGGNYYVRAIDPTTGTEVAHTVLVINEVLSPDPSITDPIGFTVITEKNLAGKAGTLVTAFITNATDSIISNLAISARPNTGAVPPTVAVSLSYGANASRVTLTQDGEIQTGERYKANSTYIKRSSETPSDFLKVGDDEIYLSTMDIEKILPQETIEVTVWYAVPAAK